MIKVAKMWKPPPPFLLVTPSKWVIMPKSRITHLNAK